MSAFATVASGRVILMVVTVMYSRVLDSGGTYNWVGPVQNKLCMRCWPRNLMTKSELVDLLCLMTNYCTELHGIVSFEVQTAVNIKTAVLWVWRGR
jgi:hypothetical protein